MLARFLIGRSSDGQAFTIDPASLTKHSVVFGATGSGKTVLCKSIIEEAASRGIPVLAIDPKGDIGCLGIRSEQFKFRPFSDVEAKLLGKTETKYEAELSSEYQNSCALAGLTGEDVKRFVNRTEVKIYTPRSSNGLPVSMSPKLTPPKNFAKMMVEEPGLALDLLDLKASNLLRLAGYSDDSRVQRSLVTGILEEEWKNGHELSLENLIEIIVRPPFDKLGILPLDEAIGPRERSELSKRLNVLVTDAGAKAWFIGEPPDFERWFHPNAGKTPVCVVDLRSIPNEQGKQVFVEYLLQELFYWLTRQEGTQTLQYLLYFDEVHGYAPPVREPPSKKILLHLIHVSRAYGLGIIMATQNPSDVDYKVISNANFRFIGNLSTRQDIERVKTGLSLGADAFETISSLKTRQFYYQVFDQSLSGILTPRWLISYHRGPLDSGELKRLRAGMSPEKVPVRILPLLIPEVVLRDELEKRRAKGGVLRGSVERVVSEKTLYVPYLEFSYRYSAREGFISKHTVIHESRSVVIGLSEIDFGFQPEILQKLPEIKKSDIGLSEVLSGADSTSFVKERIGELRRQISTNSGEPRWKLFADGLRLSSKTDLETLEVLGGNLFYVPFFIAKLSGDSESRYLAWDRYGKEDSRLTLELMNNTKFRDMVDVRLTA